MNVRWTLKAAFRLLVARAMLSFRPGAALAPGRRLPHGDRLARDTAAHLARAVQRAARRLPFRPTCLEQALALEHLLRSAGLQASVVLGVRRVGATLDAHAWLEHGGQALLGGPPADLYTSLHRTTRV